MDSIQALIVDDSSVMRKSVERSLRQAGVNLSKVFARLGLGPRRWWCWRKIQWS